jgi:hypothetical protein
MKNPKFQAISNDTLDALEARRKTAKKKGVLYVSPESIINS